jgi:putative aldouronate transport system permease protein
MGTQSTEIRIGRKRSLFARLHGQRYLLLLLAPGLIYYAIFRYGPMYGMIIAFKRFDFVAGILHSPWVGLKYFVQFAGSPYFFRLVRNTLLLSLYDLAFGFPIPILFALLLNEIRREGFKRTIQSISYLPHFISVVIIVGLLKEMASPSTGVLNHALVSLGGQPINFFMEKGWFRPLYIGSSIWQEFGWGAILYLAALSNIDPQLYEAAWMDGAGRFTSMWHITLPGLRATIIIVFLLRLGSILNVGFEKVLMMYNPAIYETADIISTFVYRSGVVQANFSFGAAVDLMNAVVTFSLIIVSNRISRKASGTSLW